MLIGNRFFVKYWSRFDQNATNRRDSNPFRVGLDEHDTGQNSAMIQHLHNYETLKN